MTPVLSSRISGIGPLWAVEGGRVTITGSGFVVDPALPQVVIGTTPARLATASTTALTAIVPPGLEGGHTPIRVEEAPGETAYVEIGVPLATGLHQVDSPAFDRHGNLYVTFSGSRGQQSPVAILHRAPGRNARTVRSRSGQSHVARLRPSTAGCTSPAGSTAACTAWTPTERSRPLRPTSASRAASPSGRTERCMSAIDRARSCASARGAATQFATIPPSVAAFHLAFGPDGWLYVTAPTLGVRDPVYRVSPKGTSRSVHLGFGRPQGLAFDAQGNLYVVDALAGAGGLYRLRADRPGEAEQLLAGRVDHRPRLRSARRPRARIE